MKKIVRSDMFDLSDINSLPTCESCLKGKMTKQPFKGKGERAQSLLDLIHTDVCGPFSIGTKYGHTYFITFTDDYSRYGYLYLMKHKSESFERFKEFKAEVENQLGKSIKALRSDRGGEYLSAEFQHYLKENGILAQWTLPATPQLNGVAEHRNRTLMDMVRSMMSFTELPTSFWGYALETAVMLLNNVHTKAVDKTPYEMWMGKPPKYSYMRIWGCPAYVKQTVGDKLDTRSILCYFVGYPKNSIGYCFYYPSETKVFVSRNATFMEMEFLLDRKGKIVELEEVREPTEVPSESLAPTEPVPEMVAPRRSERVPRAPERYGFLLEDDQGDQVVGSDPRTFKEAISDADSNLWLEAMQSEFDSMHANQVWTLVNPLEGIVPTGCKWVYNRKLGPDGKVMTYKARLVAKGYAQRQGVDYNETFSPVAMFKSIRILLAIAAWYDYEIWQMDVKTAFLNGNIKEEIYMTQPEGFTSVGSEHKVCKLQRSIYGLKQASRSWNQRFDETIKEFGFIKNPDESSYIETADILQQKPAVALNKKSAATKRRCIRKRTSKRRRNATTSDDRFFPNNQQLVALNKTNNIVKDTSPLLPTADQKCYTQNAVFQLIKTTSPLTSDWFLKPTADISAGIIPHNATADSATISAINTKKLTNTCRFLVNPRTRATAASRYLFKRYY
ncbi:hypothetical protein F511_19440 [Dorcoceras hygrometricum]|uniref:Integrase catalytic domain-containing protein n=1 Tax=Dorcoceras hygrometricum TaxID=472368 RepID=A0A2Z7AN91_9LAMI|nr:hypothetical protein F511_19440 [Dorcoceras hygrometricum]